MNFLKQKRSGQHVQYADQHQMVQQPAQQLAHPWLAPPSAPQQHYLQQQQLVSPPQDQHQWQQQQQLQPVGGMSHPAMQHPTLQPGVQQQLQHCQQPHQPQQYWQQPYLQEHQALQPPPFPQQAIVQQVIVQQHYQPGQQQQQLLLPPMIVGAQQAAGAPRQVPPQQTVIHAQQQQQPLLQPLQGQYAQQQVHINQVWPLPMPLQQQQQQQQWPPAPPGAGPVPGQLQVGVEQQQAVEAALQGYNVFLTGGAGVGKSFTVDVLVQLMRDQGRGVAKTASTGTAALNINGMTVHSFAGILDVFMHPVMLAEKLWGWGKWRREWEVADVLVLDEISMVDCDLLETVDYLARYMRGWRIHDHKLFHGRTVHELHPLPFGGLQVIAVGDFFQLPPVDKPRTWDVKPVRGKQQPQRRSRKQARELPPGTVKQQYPVVMAVLPPEAMDVHVAARGASTAAHTEEAEDLEYQRHYGKLPLRRLRQQQQQQFGDGVSGGVGGCMGSCGFGGAAFGQQGQAVGDPLQPQSALQLLQRAAASPGAAAGQTPAAPAAAGWLAGQQQVKQEQLLPQQQQQQVKQEHVVLPQQQQQQVKQEQLLSPQQQQAAQHMCSVHVKQEQACSHAAQQQQQQQQGHLQQAGVKQEWPAPHAMEEEQQQQEEANSLLLQDVAMVKDECVESADFQGQEVSPQQAASEQNPQQQQQQQQDSCSNLAAASASAASALQKLKAAGQYKQWCPHELQELKTRLLAERPDVQLPLAKKARISGLGHDLLQQQQQPVLQQLQQQADAERPDVQLPPAKKARIPGLGHDLLQQQQQPMLQQRQAHAGQADGHAVLSRQAGSERGTESGSAGGAAAAAGAVSGQRCSGIPEAPAGATSDGPSQQPDAAATPAAGAAAAGPCDGGDDVDAAADDDIGWDAASMAIEQAESQQQQRRDSLLTAQGMQSPLQALQQQQSSAAAPSPLPSPFQQQQLATPSGSALLQGGSRQSQRPSRSVPRSALSSLQLLPQAPLPFATLSLGTPQGPQLLRVAAEAEAAHAQCEPAAVAPGAAAGAGAADGPEGHAQREPAAAAAVVRPAAVHGPCEPAAVAPGAAAGAGAGAADVPEAGHAQREPAATVAAAAGAAADGPEAEHARREPVAAAAAAAAAAVRPAAAHGLCEPAGAGAGAGDQVPGAVSGPDMMDVVAAAVVAAAAVPLPADTQCEAGMEAGGVPGEVDAARSSGTAAGPHAQGGAAAAGSGAADTAEAAAAADAGDAAPVSPAVEVVDLLDDTEPELRLLLNSAPASPARAAAKADVIELLDSDSDTEVDGPIDLTLTPEDAKIPKGAAAAGGTAGRSEAPAVMGDLQGPAAAAAAWAPAPLAGHYGGNAPAGGAAGPPAQPLQHWPQQQQQQQGPWAGCYSAATILQRMSLGGAGRGAAAGGGFSSMQQRAEFAPLSDAEWFQRLRQAATLLPTPPGLPEHAAAAAAGGGYNREPQYMQDRRQRPARNVCGQLVHTGLTSSKQFEVQEVQLGHVYAPCNGRMTTAFIQGSLMDPELVSGLPQGFNWTPNPGGGQVPGFTVGQSPVGVRGSAAFGMGGSSRVGAGRLPVQFMKPIPATGAYCFKTPLWTAAKFKPAVLKQPYRQSDPELLEALNELRIGRMSTATQLLLSELQRPLPDDGITATHLYPHKDDAAAVNKAAYAALPGPQLQFPAIDRCQPDVFSKADLQRRLNHNTNAPSLAELKPGTQVLLLFNLDVLNGLANGTRGVVEEFVSFRDYLRQEHVKFPGEKEEDSSNPGGNAEHAGGSCEHKQQQQKEQEPKLQQQLPRWQDGHAPASYANLRPECGVCGVDGCPCQHQAWSTMASRGRANVFEVSVKLPDAPQPDVIQVLSEPWKRDRLQQAIIWANHTNTTQLPKCRFTVIEPFDFSQFTAAASGGGSVPGSNGGSRAVAYKTLIIGPQTWTHVANTRDHYGVRATRTQLPLLHAWAITVHKSQGMSITKLVVSLGRAFGAGMVYVALSRCTSREGLQVIGRVPPPVSDPDVKAFYNYIYDVAEGRCQQ